MLSVECEPQIPPLGLKSSVGMTNLGGSAVLDRMTRWQKLKSSVGMTERKAKSERRRAKGEQRKANSERQPAKGNQRTARLAIAESSGLPWDGLARPGFARHPSLRREP